MVSLANCTKNLKKNQYHPSNSSKIEEKVTLLNSFHKDIILIPKLDKDIMRKENTDHLTLINIETNTSKLNQAACKNDYMP